MGQNGPKMPIFGPKWPQIPILGQIFQGSPLFLALLGLCQFSISTLNFGPFSTKLGGTVRAIKKMTTEWQRTWSGPELRRSSCLWVRPKSVFLAKNAFYPKKTPKIKRLIFIWEEATFFFEQLFPVVAETWLVPKSDRFFGPETSVFGPNIRYLPYDPNFGQWPVCSPWRDRSFSTFG